MLPAATGLAATVNHELKVFLKEGTAGVEDAALAPPDIPMADIVAVAQGRQSSSVEYTVREVCARLATSVHRSVLIAGTAPLCAYCDNVIRPP